MYEPYKPPKGWFIASGVLQVDRTVTGYCTRRQDVVGRCWARDCRRTLNLDLARILRDGLGALRITQVKDLYRCSRLDGCSLAFTDDLKAESLKLSVLCRRPAVTIQLRCDACKAQLRISPEHMIARLKADGRGGEDTEVRDLKPLLTGACKACGKVAWDVQVSWPDPNTYGGSRMIDMAKPTTTGPIDPLDF